MMMFVSHLYYQTVSEYLLTVHDNRWQSILLGVYDTYSHKQVRVYQYSHKYEHLSCPHSHGANVRHIVPPILSMRLVVPKTVYQVVDSQIPLPHIFPWLLLQEGHLWVYPVTFAAFLSCSLQSLLL